MNKGRLLMRIAIALSILEFFVLSLFMYGCTRVIRDSSDELVMNSWSAKSEGGAEVSLCFEDDNASLTVNNGSNSSTVEGYCVLSLDRFIIFDEETGESYAFDYVLHGDRVELSYQNSVIILERG